MGRISGDLGLRPSLGQTGMSMKCCTGGCCMPKMRKCLSIRTSMPQCPQQSAVVLMLKLYCSWTVPTPVVAHTCCRCHTLRTATQV